MRRSLAIALALLLLALAASPTLAARSGGSGTKRGSVQVTISNVKGDSSICSVKVNGRYLADGQQVFVGAPAYGQGGDAWRVADTNSGGGVDIFDATHQSSTMDNTHVLIVMGGGWVPIYDLDGNQATWSIANNCQPA